MVKTRNSISVQLHMQVRFEYRMQVHNSRSRFYIARIHSHVLRVQLLDYSDQLLTLCVYIGGRGWRQQLLLAS